MCGIVGYVGKRDAAPILLRGLRRLEYRGYDSAGIALLHGGLRVVKRKGRVCELDGAEGLAGKIGIGHTRWATHGAPSEANAHPQVYGRFAVVHNGIIENYLALKAECLARGEAFSSETDTEVIAHLLQFDWNETGEFRAAFAKTVGRLEGAFAIAALCEGDARLMAACEKSPLIVGEGADGWYLASDIPALSDECERGFALNDGEIAELGDKIAVFDRSGGRIDRAPTAFERERALAKGRFPHRMREEIEEIPLAIENSICDVDNTLYSVLCQTNYIHIVACGTAYHSGVAAKYAIEALARVPTEATVASEYRYRDPIVGPGALVIAVSQSGETADTLAAAVLAKERGAFVLAVTNSPHSSITRVAHAVITTGAGREIAVAATKSFNAQLAALYSLAIALARAKGRSCDPSALRPLPALGAQVVASADEMSRYAPALSAAKSVFFLGRGADYCAALEGSLKLKEISYLPSEGYPAGELKHGTLALIEEGTPVVAVLTQSALAEKTMNAVSEAYARGAHVLLVTSLPEYAARREVANCVLIPKCEEIFSPILSVIPLQSLAYYTALARGNDPDRPRNLAKSVTVE